MTDEQKLPELPKAAPLHMELAIDAAFTHTVAKPDEFNFSALSTEGRE